MLFSQRNGLKEIRSVLQKDDIDLPLRNTLWNVFHAAIWHNFNSSGRALLSTDLGPLFSSYWYSYFKLPLDNLPASFILAKEYVKKYFFSCAWFEIYDFIEFTMEHLPGYLTSGFIKFCNQALESELSAYRIIDNKIVEITSETELESIGHALDNTSKYKNVHTHLSTALTLLSDRKNPDYRNSIKESISAVEAIVKTITGKDKTTFGEALIAIERSGQIHPAFKKSLTALYGYTSDSDGIRHSLMEEDILTLVDANFLLVTCTAFINYILGKISSNN